MALTKVTDIWLVCNKIQLQTENYSTPSIAEVNFSLVLLLHVSHLDMSTYYAYLFLLHLVQWVNAYMFAVWEETFNQGPDKQLIKSCSSLSGERY